MNLSSTRCLAFIALVTLAACGGGGGGGSSTPPPVPVPTISGIAPTHASPGTTVALTGTNLTGATAVAFNGKAAFSFTVASSTEIDAVVPGSATSGTIQVTTPNGATTSPSFTVDAALVPTLASFTPSALASGTVATLTGTHFVGATQVQFNGVNATSFSVASDTQIQATAPAGLSAGAITVTTPAGTATSGTNYTLNLSVQGQVLMNGGFEQTAPLVWQGDIGIISTAPGASSPNAVPNSGAKFAWLGGYGVVASDLITQDVFVPSTATSASLSFYLKIATSETGTAATDTFTVSALSTTNAVLGTLLTKSNLNAAPYTLFTADLLPYKGQVVRLAFKSQEDAQNATSFLLDDVATTISVPSAADLKPIITSFTPTSGVAGEVSVLISGRNFFGLTSVTIGGASAAYTLTDGTSLTAIPAPSATGSAPISITNAQGTGASSTNFSVVFGVPTVTSINPTQGPVGSTVVVTGTYLGYPATTVTLNGQAIALATQSVNQLTFVVPAGANSGSLVITTPGGTQTRTFTVNTATATLDLHVDKVQLTQSTQTLSNSVPIVAGKNGLVRAFVLANVTNTATPAVAITLLNNGVAVAGYPKTVTAPTTSVPTTLDETSLTASWNLVIPGTDLTTPTGTGYSVQAVVDPTNAVAEADETNNSTTVALTGVTVPIFKTTIFPVALASGTGDISAANKDAWAARLAKMYPISSVDVAVGATFTSSVTLVADGTGWDTLLNDLTAKHLADGASDRYYYGALNVSYSSGVAGLGWVPPASNSLFKYRTAIGWDKSAGYADGGLFPEVFAHETGHNMGRQHSPCPVVNGPASPDPAYPYAGGSIGVWGYDSTANLLKTPATYKDIMAYCTPVWVSDYVYKSILTFRGGTGGFLTVGAEDAPLAKAQAVAKECLLVRGIVHDDGKVELLPSFRTKALPSDLPSHGEFTLECLDQKGQSVFTTPIDLMELGCWPKGHERHFVMALPLDSAVLDSLATLKVLKAGQVQASLRSVSSSARIVATAPEVHRLAEDRMQLTWDASVHGAALVRDADTGEVIAILSGGRQSLTTKSRRFDVTLSDGVTGPMHHIESAD